MTIGRSGVSSNRGCQIWRNRFYDASRVSWLQALQELVDEFEIDFVSLSFARTGEDVAAAREVLDSMGMHNTKVCQKRLGHYVSTCDR